MITYDEDNEEVIDLDRLRYEEEARIQEEAARTPEPEPEPEEPINYTEDDFRRDEEDERRYYHSSRRRRQHRLRNILTFAIFVSLVLLGYALMR